MDVRYINPFVESVKNFFSTMLDAELLVSKPFLTLQADEQRADVSAIIDITGDAEGWVALRFPMQSAVSTAWKFAGEYFSADEEHLIDAVGEMANIVAGRAKSKLSDLNCVISPPHVTIGVRPAPNHPTGMPRLVLPCNSQLGRFSVEAQLIVQPGVQTKPVEAAGDETSETDIAAELFPVQTTSD